MRNLKRGISEACEESRTNRFICIVLVLAVGLTLLIITLFAGLVKELRRPNRRSAQDVT